MTLMAIMIYDNIGNLSVIMIWILMNTCLSLQDFLSDHLDKDPDQQLIGISTGKLIVAPLMFIVETPGGLNKRTK